jgi:mRNA-degrading endonuclease HigB of HigAB toxin-antitoxin module
MAWHRQTKAADWATPADAKRDIATASILRDWRVAFNVAGMEW